MFRTKMIYRLISVFLIFAVLTLAPLTVTIVKQVNKMIEQEEEVMMKPDNAEYAQFHRDFSLRLIEQLVPFVFYILVLAFMLSLFFMRKMLLPLKQLQKGASALRDGNLDLRLDVSADDELGDALRSFNEMADSLRETTNALRQKDIYLNAMLDPLWVVDRDNNIVDVNRAFTDLLGYERDLVIGMSIYDFFDERNAAIIRDQLQEYRDRGESSIYEVSVIRRDGALIPVLISGSPILEEGRVVGKIGILKDFREHKSLRDELKRSRDYIESIMDSIEDNIFVIDRDYRIVTANRAAMSGAHGPVIGEYCHAVSHSSGRPCWTEGHDCPVRTVFLSGRNFSAMHQHVGAKGEKLFQEITASPIKDSHGNVLQVIELVRDITERARHEYEMSIKNRELVALNSIAGLLSRSLRADEIFAQVLDRLLDVIAMDGGGLYLIDEARKELDCRYHRGISEEFLKLIGRIRIGEDLPGKVAVSGNIFASSDFSKDSRSEKSMIRHSGVKGYCCFPVRGKERIIGVFFLFSFRPHAFSEEEENILSSIGEMTGIALENVRLYEKMRELYEYQRRRREDEQGQLLALSTKLGSAIDLPDILDRVLDLIRNFFSADFVWLLFHDDSGGLSVKGSSDSTWTGRSVYPKGAKCLEAYAIERRSPTVISDLSAETQFSMCPEIEGQPYRSAIAVPLYIGEKTIGACSLYSLAQRDFRDEEMHFLRIISNILSVSLERSDYHARAIMEKGLSETILRSAADGIITLDTKGRIIAVNKVFETLTGRQASGLVGLPFSEVFPQEGDSAGFGRTLLECVEAALEGNRLKKEVVFPTAAGAVANVLIHSAPVLNADGQVTGVVNLIRDISREKEIDRMKTELIRTVSHEFRTPLSAIVGMTEMILDGEVDDNRQRQYLNTILGEGVRLSDMVSDLLNIDRIESGRDELFLSRVDMEEMLRNVAGSFAGLARKKGARIIYEAGVSGYVLCDEEKIRQILINLIDNALTFSDDGCTVRIGVAREGDEVRITVSDDGWGIPEEDLPHLAERFYRGRNGVRIKGAGLGLSLCSEFMKMHGGRMSFSSSVGVGTDVFVHLPYKEAA